MFGNAIQAQDVTRNMFVTNGHFVFRVVKIIPVNLVGVIENDESGSRIVPTYTGVQVITSRGSVLNLSITDKLFPVLV